MADCGKCNAPLQQCIFMEDDAIALTQERLTKKGCPYCNNDDGKRDGYADSYCHCWLCNNCGKISLIFKYTNVEKSHIHFGNPEKTWIPKILK